MRGFLVLRFLLLGMGFVIAMTIGMASRAENDGVKGQPVKAPEAFLLKLKSIDSSTEDYLLAYVTNPKLSEAQKIPTLMQIFDKIMSVHEKTHQPDRANRLSAKQIQYYQNQVLVVNLLRILIGEFTRSIDLVDGTFSVHLMKRIANANLTSSDPLNSSLDQFADAMANTPVRPALLAKELVDQKGIILNEVVRSSLLHWIFVDINKVYGQEATYLSVIKSIVQPHHFFPVIVSPSFSGKTEFFKEMTRNIMLRMYPPNPVFHDYFKNAIVLHFEGSQLDQDSISDTMNAILDMKIKTGRPILVAIEDLHRLAANNSRAAGDFYRSVKSLRSKGVYFLGTVTEEGLGTFKKAVAVKNIDETLTSIPIRNLSMDDFTKVTLQLANSRELRRDLRVEFQTATLEKMARYVHHIDDPKHSPFYLMRQILEEVAVDKLTREPLNPSPISVRDFKRYLNGKKYLPFTVDDPASVETYYKDLSAKIRGEITGQDRMVRELLDMHRDLLLNAEDGRAVRVMALVGGTGVGKSGLVKVFGKFAYGDKKKVFRIEGTNVNKKENLWRITGATVGYTGSDKKGQLIEFLDGPGHDGGVVLIDEGEKACPEFWEIMLPAFEDALVYGGDGRPRHLKNILFVITSNRGAKQLYPKGFELWPEDQQKAHIEGFTQGQLKALFTEPNGSPQDLPFQDFVVERFDRIVAADQAQLAVALNYLPTLVKDIRAHFMETNEKEVVIDEDLIEAFVRSNFRMASGYRPLFRSFNFSFRRIVQNALPLMGVNDKRLRLSLGQRDQSKIVMAKVGRKSKVMEFEFPTVNEDSVFRDQAMMERLTQLPQIFNEKITGQDHIIEPLVAAVRKHVINSQSARKSVLAFFNVGPTGVGKTSIAKVLALALMGSEDRLGIIPMGEINSRHKWANFFGGDIGFQGGDVIRLFEQSLRNNPRGGVIVLDEFSAIGGGDKDLKTEFSKLILNMIDEARWISPTTGLEYDLSKYIFLLTGNDGSELYHGATDDHLRQITWERNNKPDRIQEILFNAGVPKELLGRMAALFWARPLNHSEMRHVGQNFLEAEVISLAQRNIKIVYDPDFIDRVISYAYTVDLGARSVRNFVENAFGGLIAQVEVKGFEKAISLAGAEIRISFGDEEKRLPIVTHQSQIKDEVYLYADVETAKGITWTERLGTRSFLSPRRSQIKREAYKVALHEGGHAIVSDFSKVGLKILSITIDASGDHLGYVNYDPDTSKQWTRKRVVARIATSLAGGLAQQLAGFELDNGWSGDLNTARTYATKAIKEWGLGTELKSIFYPQEKEDQSAIPEDILEQEVFSLMSEGYKLSKSILGEQWKLNLDLARQLMLNFTVSGESYENLKGTRRRGTTEYRKISERGVDRMKPISSNRGFSVEGRGSSMGSQCSQSLKIQDSSEIFQ